LFATSQPAKIAGFELGGACIVRRFRTVGRVLSKIAIFAKIDIEGRVSESPGEALCLIFKL